MMEILSLIWLVILAAWVGSLIGERSERKRHERSHEQFARQIIDVAHGLRKTRSLVGDGPRVTHEGRWRLGDAGTFTVIIAEAEDEKVP